MIEEALRHHLRALQDLPEDVIPSTLVLTKESFEEVVREMESPAPPSRALRRLMSRDVDIRPLRPEDDRSAFRSGDADFTPKVVVQGQARTQPALTQMFISIARLKAAL